jgi:molybdopterin-binding protein
MSVSNLVDDDHIRLGEAAGILGVSPDTVRRWVDDGRLPAERSSGGQRLVRRADVARLVAERRRAGQERPIVGQSARNRFPGVVTRIERDAIVGLIEVQAGPHRVVSLMTAEAIDELGLAVGAEAVCVVKATNVIVEVLQARGASNAPASEAFQQRR